MSSQKTGEVKVNIVGAGISGLTAGCYLQMNGFKTEIFEKHSIPGGLCTSWQKEGYTFDGCVHWILGTGPGSVFYKLWSELLDMQKIPFVNHENRIDVEVKTPNRHGDKIFRLYTKLDRLEAYLLDLSPQDAEAIRFFIQPMRIMQKFDLPPIMDDVPFPQSMIRGIKMARYLEFLALFLKYRKETNLTLAKRFKDPFLKESFEMLYDGEEVNLIVIMMPLSCFDANSAGYPIGGSLGFAKRLAESYEMLGGKIHYNTPVHEILVEDGETKGIRVRNNVVHYSDLVLSSADWHHTAFNLLQGKYANENMKKHASQKGMDVFFSILHVSFGVGADLSHLEHLTRYPLDMPIVSPDGTQYERMEIHVYNYDPTLAPAGKTVVTVSFYTRNAAYWIDLRKNQRVDYRAVKEDFVNQVRTALLRRLPEIEGKIEVEDFGTPATVLRYTNSWLGSTQGWLPTTDNIIPKSPVGYTFPGLKNFYYSSHWNRPGGGLPIAIENSRTLVKMLCKRYKKKFSTANAPYRNS